MTEWIKCSDKMPDKDGRYLVCEQYSTLWIGVSSLRKGVFDGGVTTTHWMPLPEPPELDK